jgi:alpha-tubulin suppressor-like RCC1 family protein
VYRPRLVRRRSFVPRFLPIALAIFASACDAEVRTLSWEFVFADETLAARALVVEGRILEGGCTSSSVRYAAESTRTMGPVAPPRLEPGRYGFEGNARDASCVVFASGCQELDVPQAEGALVTITLSDTTPRAACDAELCTMGSCAGALDGGASRDAGPPLDAGRDAGCSNDAGCGPSSPVDRLIVGGSFACAITTEGALHCWGNNNSGQLGNGPAEVGMHASDPIRVELESDWTLAGVGHEHVCAARGDLYCWGDNMDGQLATDDLSDRSRPTIAMAPAETWVAIDGATLGDSTALLSDDGTIYAIGQNDYGQLGLGDTTTPRRTPVAMSGTWRTVSYGHHSACAIRTDGALLCWGRGNVGQLGIGTLGASTIRSSPVQVGTRTDWTAVDVGDGHACGVRAGELYCWGNNLDGQLGIGSTTSNDAPARVGADATWSQVSLGLAHSCAIRTDGSLWCWGANDLGQLGLGSTGADQTTPARVGTESDWEHVGAGEGFTCGLRAGRRVACFGANEFGELGQGDTTMRDAPVEVVIPRL